MDDLKRLLESSPRARTRALLHAGRRERPPQGSAQRVLLAVAAGATTTGVAVAAKAGAAASSGGGTGSAAASSLLASTMKWLAVGALSGGALSAGALAVDPGGPEPAAHERPLVTAPEVTPSSAKPSTPELRAEVSGPVAAPSPAPPPLNPTPSLPAAPARNSEPGPDTEQGKLEREVRWIDAARRALASGDSGRALAELEHYDRLVETHILDREAAVLRIEALAQRGDGDRARRLFEAYLRQYPGDTHVARLRRALGIDP